jgi:hypothetical protein
VMVAVRKEELAGRRQHILQVVWQRPRHAHRGGRQHLAVRWTRWAEVEDG